MIFSYRVQRKQRALCPVSMQVVSRQMGGLGLGGKAGGLQDMIKEATAENRPGPDWHLNRSIVEYINRSPNRHDSQ